MTEIEKAYSYYLGFYSTVTEVIFLLFLVFLFLVFLIGRTTLIRKMNDSIFMSRAILGLIPNVFFHQNKQLIDKIMNKLSY